MGDAIGCELSALSCALSLCVLLSQSGGGGSPGTHCPSEHGVLGLHRGTWFVGGTGERALPVLQSLIQRIFSYVFNELGKRAPEEVPGDVGAAQQAPV